MSCIIYPSKAALQHLMCIIKGPATQRFPFGQQCVCLMPHTRGFSTHIKEKTTSWSRETIKVHKRNVWESLMHLINMFDHWKSCIFGLTMHAEKTPTFSTGPTASAIEASAPLWSAEIKTSPAKICHSICQRGRRGHSSLSLAAERSSGCWHTDQSVDGAEREVFAKPSESSLLKCTLL